MTEAGTKIEQMTGVLATLWAIPAPGPDNILQDPAFVQLRAHCEAHYPSAVAGTGLTFALADALRSLGLPCMVRAGTPVDGLSLDMAAARLVAGLETRSITRRYLCPLDLADDLPALEFGPVRLRQYTKAELADLFDDERLRRLYPSHRLDSARLAQFQWLIVEETESDVPEIGRRALPFFYDLGSDLGAIDAHAGQYAPAVIEALFPLLLEPWEDWNSLVGVGGDWRGFLVPWVHVETGDLFVRPRMPPNADGLTWEEAYGHDGEDYERPVIVHLDSEAQDRLARLDQACWDKVQAAARTDLFSTPIQHFLVRGFFTEGMDQIMSHMTAIEAALGMQADFGEPPPGIAKMGSKKRLTKRIEALLGNKAPANDYAALFELRSRFVHGRAFGGKVSSEERNKARRLARTVIAALIDVAAGPAGTMTREDYLWSLGKAATDNVRCRPPR